MNWSLLAMFMAGFATASCVDAIATRDYTWATFFGVFAILNLAMALT